MADQDPQAFLEEEARRNPVPDLETAVRVADSLRHKKVITDRKERTRSLLMHGTAEEKRRAPGVLEAHLAQPRAVGKR